MTMKLKLRKRAQGDYAVFADGNWMGRVLRKIEGGWIAINETAIYPGFDTRRDAVNFLIDTKVI